MSKKTRLLPVRLLLLLVVGLAFGQSPVELLTPAVRRVGEKLACLCGSCKNTVATCPMLECHYAEPARKRIAQLQAAGMSDEAIVADFVKREGKRALAVPPAEGFHLMGWVMPFVAIMLGLAGIYLFIRRFHRPAAPATPADPALLERYQDRIEQDLAKLE